MTMIYKASLAEEYSKLRKPIFKLFPEKAKEKKSFKSSLETRVSSFVMIIITVAQFPLEETYHISSAIKKITIFPHHLFPCIYGCFKGVNQEKTKKDLAKIGLKIFDSIAHAIIIPLIRLCFIIRLLAAAIIHPKIAFISF
jgi:hypothetical protein